jgi:putative heme-binding domain-containing protein
LGSATTAELVAALDHPNSWWRETAQRLIFERQDKSAVKALRSLLRKSRTPQGRLHALWTLEGLQALTADDLLGPLQDVEAGVRAQALKLAESGIKASAALHDRVLALAKDPDPVVRLQAAFTLGASEDARALPVLAEILRRDAADPWIRTAVLSSTADTSDQLLARLLADPSFPGAAALIRELAQVVGVRGKSPEMQRVLDATPPRGSSAVDVVAGLGDGLKRSGRSLRAAGLDTAGANRIAQSLDDAAVQAANMQAPVPIRTTAIQLLAFDEFDRVRATLGSLLEARQPQEIQQAAVTALASFSRVETGPMLLASWNTYTPAIRGEVVLAMLGNRLRVPALLAAIERGEIPGHQVPFARRALLLRSADEKTKELATRLFGDGATTSRAEVVSKYRPALALKGDAARGRKVFELACAACHRASASGVILGNDVGPNLATIRQWNPDQILVNILDPNREVSPNFVGYLVETQDGRTLDGMIAEENAASLTLKRAGGAQETVLRRDIKQLTGLKTSLMPDGLEAAISVEQMADLLAFLRE